VSDVANRVARGNLDPVYVLSSEHPILVDRLVAAIRDAAVPAAMRAWNYDVVEGKPSSARIVAAAQTLPMMGERRMVLVRDLATLPADDAPQLVAYFAAPNPSSVVVALTSKLDKRLSIFKAAAKHGYLHVLEAPRNAQGWIRAEAEARGVALEPHAMTRLQDTVGNDLSRLALVIEQLGLYAVGRGVTADDVDDLIADTRERTVFELTDAIGAGDTGAALAAISALCDQRDSAIGVIAMLARFVRQLALVHVHRGRGKGELAPLLGVPPFVVDKLATQARRYPPDHLLRATRLLAAADRAIKGDPTVAGRFTGPQVKALGRDLAERVIMERLVVEMVGVGAGAVASRP
jgi:DNA polymerase-3 subunit delta